MKEKIKELAKVGRKEYEDGLKKYVNPQVAEDVADNKIWQAIKEMQDRREPDFLTLEWYNWIHSGEYFKQQRMRKCKDAIMYRMACKTYKKASAM